MWGDEDTQTLLDDEKNWTLCAIVSWEEFQVVILNWLN